MALAAFSPSDSTYTDSGLKNKVRQTRVVFNGTMQRDFLIQLLPTYTELNQSEEDQGGL
jgi:hypothetical protein